MGQGVEPKAVDGRGLRVAVVAARWNAAVTDPLVAGALGALAQAGVAKTELVRVPGAFELPLAARWAAESGRFDAVVALGAVIKGDTPHFDFVAGACADGLARVALDSGVPVAFGVLTTFNLDQALARAVHDDKGGEAARAAIEMVHTRAALRPRAGGEEAR